MKTKEVTGDALRAPRVAVQIPVRHHRVPEAGVEHPGGIRFNMGPSKQFLA